VEICFGEHRLDVDRRELRRGANLIAVEPQVFDLLLYLVRNRDRVVSKDDLIAGVWRGRIVSESTLTGHVHAARKAVGDSGEAQSLIRTLPRKGYRFVGEVQEVRQQAMPAGGDLPRAPLAAAIPQAPSAPRLSIVVLPFTNLSDERDQQYFADGITDDLTTDLSRIAGLLVISRNTAFTYRNKAIDTKQIGRELGVRYALEGSVRRSGSQVRVNAQLIDAATDAHLWAERFDRDISDLFTVQNEITSCLANALKIELIAATVARPAQHPDALDYILRGRAVLLKPRTLDTYREAIELFERALVLDPQSVDGQSRLAAALGGRVLDQMTHSAATDLERAEALTSRLLTECPRSPLGHLAKGLLLRAQNRFQEAIAEFESALASNPNWVNALGLLGQCKLLIGLLDEAILLLERAIRLSPRDPYIGSLYWRIGLVHLLEARTDEAIVWLERARSHWPQHPLPRAYLASSYALAGEIKRAAVELIEARKLSTDERYSSLARLRAIGAFQSPKLRDMAETTYFAGLRKAGMPEE
jgi:TolB-like protein/Flp pilus assembly protein TadD